MSLLDALLDDSTGLMLDEPPLFLTAAEVPPNLLRLKAGDRVRWADGATPRRVVRVGYRKSACDYLPDADRALRDADAWAAARRLLALGMRDRDLRYALARGLAQRDRLGGPERGLHVRDATWLDREMTVTATRVVRLGTYYPPSGGGEDHEDGGLADARSVVLVSVGCAEVVSGDLVRVPR